MNRIEAVRGLVDEILLNMTDARERRCGYLHLYGVAQACALIALKRGADAELAAIAGMLHDIHTYSAMDAREHAQKGARQAREMLASLHLFEEREINAVCEAIRHHSEKAEAHAPFDEVLIDADVMQHRLYNPLAASSAYERARFARLRAEFGLPC